MGMRILITAAGALACLVLQGGEGVRVSERFGFDPADSTRFLQAALDSGLPKIVVDRQDAPWVCGPLRGASGQEVVFEPGVEVVAKSGAFLPLRESLLTYENASDVRLSGRGATLRMRKADYMKPPYRRGQWRHVLNFLSCSRVRVEGLTLADSGGDGVYIGVSGNDVGVPCRDVTISGVTCDGNLRQGISVISVDGLLVENCTLKNTGGHPPEAGIDFEANYPGQLMKDIVVRGCAIMDNTGPGFGFSLWGRDASAVPVSARIEDCRIERCRQGFWYTGNARSGTYAQGKITVRKCVFRDCPGAGMSVCQKPRTATELKLVECRFENCCTDDRTDACFSFRSGYRSDPPVDGIVFDDVTVKTGNDRPLFSRWEGSWVSDDVRALSGRIRLVGPKGDEMVALDSDWRKKSFPPRSVGATPSRRSFTAAPKVVDGTPGVMRSLPRFRLRQDVSYVFYADSLRDAHLVLEMAPVGQSRPLKKPVSVMGLDGRTLRSYAPLKEGVNDMVVFRAKRMGLYLLKVPTGWNTVTLVQADVPVGIDVSSGEQDILASAGTLHFPASKDTPFAVFAGGQNRRERLSYELRDPTGKLVASNGSLGGWDRFLNEKGGPAGLWSLKVGKPKSGLFEDFNLDLVGLPSVFFLTADRYWQE